MGDHYEDFEGVKKKLLAKKKPFHLLLGNGFSMAYDKEIFSYNSLSNYVENQDNDLLKKLFEVANTRNFEQIMEQLRVFIELCKVFGDTELPKKINVASDSLKEELINAIDAMHPYNVFDIPREKGISCSKFLDFFLSNQGHVFTTNYDLLLYWVLMRNANQNHVDGFGRDLENEEEITKGKDPVFSELRWGNNKTNQCVHYLHGAMHIFDDGIEVIKEQYDTGTYLTEKIKKRLESKQYPIFVAAGNSEEKLKHIYHNRYLSYCYEQLCEATTALVTFGFSFGESDDHIINAINTAHKQDFDRRLFSIYIGVYSDNGRKHIDSIRHKFRCKVNTFNARSVPIWEG